MISKSYRAESVGPTREDVCVRKGADCEESKEETILRVLHHLGKHMRICL